MYSSFLHIAIFSLLIFDLGFYLLSVILACTFPFSVIFVGFCLIDKMDWGYSLFFLKSQSLW